MKRPLLCLLPAGWSRHLYRRLPLWTGLAGGLLLSAIPLPVRAQGFVLGANGANFIEVDENFVFRNIVPSASTAAEARSQLITALEIHLEDLQRTCNLTENQSRKLRLAGEMDAHRFMTGLASLPAGKHRFTQEEWRKIHLQMQPLQNRYKNGIYGPGSVFQKSTATTLTDQQLTAFQQARMARAKRQYQAAVKATVSIIDGQLPLTSSQRDRLVQIILEKTSPPVNAPSDYLQTYLVLYALSTVPEEDLRPIFEAAEWLAIVQLRTQGRSMKSLLTQHGIFDEDGGTERGTSGPEFQGIGIF